MKIIEHFICGKYNKPDICEDGIVIGNNLIAVIDGVTCKGKRLWENMSSGCFAKMILQEYLRKDIANQNAEELLENLDIILNTKLREQKDDVKIEDYPRASIIIYNNIYKEIWSYGDCQCSINGKVYDHTKKIDILNSELRAFFIEFELLKGKTVEDIRLNDIGREKIKKNLVMQLAFENVLGYFGYPVLNGQGIEKSMIRKYQVKPGDQIVLASDRYPILKSSLMDSENELQNIKNKDQLCYKEYRSTKGIEGNNVSFDDRTYCRFEV